jgi:hypothetical protein
VRCRYCHLEAAAFAAGQLNPMPKPAEARRGDAPAKNAGGCRCWLRVCVCVCCLLRVGCLLYVVYWLLVIGYWLLATYTYMQYTIPGISEAGALLWVPVLLRRAAPHLCVLRCAPGPFQRRKRRCSPPMNTKESTACVDKLAKTVERAPCTALARPP